MGLDLEIKNSIVWASKSGSAIALRLDPEITNAKFVWAKHLFFQEFCPHTNCFSGKNAVRIAQAVADFFMIRTVTD